MKEIVTKAEGGSRGREKIRGGFLRRRSMMWSVKGGVRVSERGTIVWESEIRVNTEGGRTRRRRWGCIMKERNKNLTKEGRVDAASLPSRFPVALLRQSRKFQRNAKHAAAAPLKFREMVRPHRPVHRT